MQCKWCNKEVQENSKFCGYCGGNLTSQNTINNQVLNENTQVFENPQPKDTVVNTNIQQQNTINNAEEKKVNVGLVILSVFIPIAGLIIFLVKKGTDKKTAKASGIAALISFAVSTIISIISASLIFASIGSFVGDIVDEVEDNIENEDLIPDYNFPELDIEDGNNDVVTDSDWKNYEFSVNNQTLKLPCTYNELSLATSSVFQSSDLQSYLQSGYYSILNMYKDNNLSLYVEMLNDTDIDVLYTDAKVTRISQTEYHTSVGAHEITFPGGLKVGQVITQDEITNLLGTPDDIDIYTSDGYVKNTYTYVEDTSFTTTNYYKIIVINDIIDELSLDNRNYN